MNAKRWVVVLAGFLGIGLLASVLCAAVGFRFLHPQRPDLHFAVRNGHVVLQDSLEKAYRPMQPAGELMQGEADDPTVVLPGDAPGPQTMVTSPPHAHARETTCDFGILPPHADRGHVFIVENHGQQDLILRPGSTSCKCTFAKLPNPVVKPGDTGRVMLQWNTGQRTPHYAQWATIQTNDPNQPEIQFQITGKVSVDFAPLSDLVLFEGLNPHESQSRETLLYSREWEQFPVPQATCTLEGFRCELEPATSEELAALEAVSGYRLTVHAPMGLPQGPFAGAIRVTADGPTGPEQREIIVQGAVLRRFCLYGPGVSSEGILDLGIHKPRQGAQHKLLINLRDEDPQLRLKGIRVEPDFIQTSIEPFRPEQGLYHLLLTIPKGAPTCNHLNPQDMGVLRIVLDHPRIEPQEFRLRLCIMP